MVFPWGLLLSCPVTTLLGKFPRSPKLNFVLFYWNVSCLLSEYELYAFINFSLWLTFSTFVILAQQYVFCAHTYLCRSTGQHNKILKEDQRWTAGPAEGRHIHWHCGLIWCRPLLISCIASVTNNNYFPLKFTKIFLRMINRILF